MKSASTATAPSSAAAPRVHYQRNHVQELPADVLFAVGFGARAPGGARRVTVPLEPLCGGDVVEIWEARGAVISGETGVIRFSHDDHFLAGLIEIPERDHGGLAEATAFAYHAIATFQPASGFPHLLRTWNYFDAINLGCGEAERYRGFCAGRVAGLEQWRQPRHPAATVIGRRDGERVLQVYWLAGRQPGAALENPRQVPAWQYPREYGETSPAFSRAMLVAPDLLMISGTASIVGHESTHPGDTRAQVREIFANLDSLLARAQSVAPALPRHFGRHTLIKAYLRHREELPVLEDELRAHLPADSPLLVLHGDVCRAELSVEFDCLQSG